MAARTRPPGDQKTPTTRRTRARSATRQRVQSSAGPDDAWLVPSYGKTDPRSQRRASVHLASGLHSYSAGIRPTSKELTRRQRFGRPSGHRRRDSVSLSPPRTPRRKRSDRNTRAVSPRPNVEAGGNAFKRSSSRIKNTPSSSVLHSHPTGSVEGTESIPKPSPKAKPVAHTQTSGRIIRVQITILHADLDRLERHIESQLTAEHESEGCVVCLEASHKPFYPYCEVSVSSDTQRFHGISQHTSASVSTPRHRFRTKTVRRKGFHPKWNQTFKAKVPAGTLRLRLAVYSDAKTPNGSLSKSNGQRTKTMVAGPVFHGAARLDTVLNGENSVKKRRIGIPLTQGEGTQVGLIFIKISAVALRQSRLVKARVASATESKTTSLTKPSVQKINEKLNPTPIKQPINDKTKVILSGPAAVVSSDVSTQVFSPSSRRVYSKTTVGTSSSSSNPYAVLHRNYASLGALGQQTGNGGLTVNVTEARRDDTADAGSDTDSVSDGALTTGTPPTRSAMSEKDDDDDDIKEQTKGKQNGMQELKVEHFSGFYPLTPVPTPVPTRAATTTAPSTSFHQSGARLPKKTQYQDQETIQKAQESKQETTTAVTIPPVLTAVTIARAATAPESLDSVAANASKRAAMQEMAAIERWYQRLQRNDAEGKDFIEDQIKLHFALAEARLMKSAAADRAEALKRSSLTQASMDARIDAVAKECRVISEQMRRFKESTPAAASWEEVARRQQRLKETLERVQMRVDALENKADKLSSPWTLRASVRSGAEALLWPIVVNFFTGVLVILAILLYCYERGSQCFDKSRRNRGGQSSATPSYVRGKIQQLSKSIRTKTQSSDRRRRRQIDSPKRRYATRGAKTLVFIPHGDSATSVSGKSTPQNPLVARPSPRIAEHRTRAPLRAQRNWKSAYFAQVESPASPASARSVT